MWQVKWTTYSSAGVQDLKYSTLRTLRAVINFIETSTNENRRQILEVKGPRTRFISVKLFATIYRRHFP